MIIASAVLTGITLIGPFTGAQSESFENSYPTFSTDCVTNRTFNGTADICTPSHAGCLVTTSWTTTACTQYPHSGSWFFGNAAQGDPDNYTRIDFDQPVVRFGGMFSKNTTYSGGDISFYSADGTLLATLPIDLPGGCAWVWNGWDAGTEPAFKTIILQGSFNSPILLDDLQVDLAPPSPGTDTCFPGTGSVLPCPCVNPGELGRGCDNSAATGGARLDASGSASLQADTLVFTTNGERPAGTSVLLQGTAQVSNGAGFGQGVRCAAGSLKRLYVKTAAGGSIVVPGPGDPPVSARSAALGDTIAAGTSRWYAVFYRDPIVLGGCAAASTFNTTQTQLVSWGS
jgi:hypothetical protein